MEEPPQKPDHADVGTTKTFDQPASEFPNETVGFETNLLLPVRLSGNTSERYVLKREIAHGGMGVVYEAYDKILERSVAVKTIRADRKLSESMLSRFIFETQVTGRLQHPGIPPVHDLGCFSDDRPFLVMKLIQGRTLADALKDVNQPLALDSRLRIFEQICDAVGFAHAQGVIHRDLKPANVMVGEFGEVQVMDWGLAREWRNSDADQLSDTIPTKPNDSRAELTQSGSIMGTPAYMPPEQARGELDRLGPTSDVFSLGAILCELLSGKPPYSGSNTMAVLQQAATNDTEEALKTLESLNLPNELMTIVRRCLAGEPTQRYPEGRDLGQVVAQYRAGVETRLRELEQERVTAEVKAVEGRRRRRLQIGLVAAAVALVLLVSGGYFWTETQRAQRAQTIARQATSALAEATTLRDRAREQPDSPARWEAAQAAAIAARNAVASSDTEPQTRTQIEDFANALEIEATAARQAIDRATVHRHWIERFDATRYVALSRAEGESFDDAGQNEAYIVLFRELGIELNQGAATDAATKLQTKQLPVEIAASLDDWARTRGRAFGLEDPSRRWLLSVALALDTDVTRSAIRQEVLAGDRTRILNRLQQPDTVNLSLPTLLCLTAAVPDAANEIAALLRKVWTSRPADFWVAIELGRCLLPMGQNEEAIRCFTTAITLRPEVPAPYLMQGYALKVLNRREEALRAFEKATELEPNSPWSHINLYELYLQTNQPALAVKHAELAVNNVSNKPAAEQAWYLRFYARALLHAKKYDQCIAIARKALELNPNDANRVYTIHYLAHSHIWIGKVDEAIEWFEKAQAIKSHAIFMHYFGLDLQNAAKDLAKARSYFTRCAEQYPNYAPNQTSLAWLVYLQGERNQALEILRKSVALDPSHFWTHYFLGVIRMDGGEQTLAANHFRVAERINPKHVETRFRLCFCLSIANDHEAALASGQAALKLEPDNAKAHSYYGFAQIRSGDIAGAEKSLREAIRLMPDLGFAHQFLADNFLIQMKNPEALVEAERAFELEGKNPWISLTLAKARMANGDIDGTKKAFQEAIRLSPSMREFVPKEYLDE